MGRKYISKVHVVPWGMGTHRVTVIRKHRGWDGRWYSTHHNYDVDLPMLDRVNAVMAKHGQMNATFTFHIQES